MSEVHDTLITNNHTVVQNIVLRSKLTLLPDEDLQYVVEMLQSISKWQLWEEQ